MQIKDWLDDLDPYSPSIVADACVDWRRHNHRRPTPADILKLCRELVPAPPRQPYVPQWLLDAEAKGYWPIPSDPNLVRENWRDIPLNYLTAAEKNLFLSKNYDRELFEAMHEGKPLPKLN